MCVVGIGDVQPNNLRALTPSLQIFCKAILLLLHHCGVTWGCNLSHVPPQQTPLQKGCFLPYTRAHTSPLCQEAAVIELQGAGNCVSVDHALLAQVLIDGVRSHQGVQVHFAMFEISKVGTYLPISIGLPNTYSAYNKMEQTVLKL